MKKMSRLQTAVVAAGAAFLLAACSSGGGGTAASNAPADSTGADTKGAETSGAESEKAGDGEPVELRISWWGSDARHEATLKALDLFMEKHPDIKVTAEYQGWDGYHDKLMTQISSGTEPDVYQLDNNVYFASLAANDKLGDLTPYIGKQLNLDDYPDSALTWARYNGVQYGVPSGLNGPLFIWNKKIFDEAGVAYPTNEWSWEDFEKACQEIYDKTGKYGMKEPSYFLTMTMVRQAGQWFASEDGKLLDFTQALSGVYEQYNKWRETGVFPPLDLTVGQESQQDNLFLSCDAACEVNHIATMPQDHAAMAEEVELGVSLVPGTAQNGGAYMLASMPWTLGKASKHPEEAATLIDFLINDKDAAKILMTVRGVPAPESIREIISPMLEGDALLVVDGVNLLVENTERIDYEWLVPGSAVIENTIMDEQYATGYGQKTPLEAAANAFKIISESVDNSK
ncbi:MAG: sugar ABC transporter substrate-binding protein [Lacrimispora sp.]